MHFTIASEWNGEPAGTDEVAEVTLLVEGNELILTVDAPFFDDPAPRAPAGRVDGLWEYEVVEVFLVGPGERYVEIELGPHGHHLALRFEGARRLVRAEIPLAYRVLYAQSRWHGVARVALADLPIPIGRANAFAIHGEGELRRYLAAHPLPGDVPDFHRIDDYPPFSLAVR